MSRPTENHYLPGDKHRGYPLGGGWLHPADADPTPSDELLARAECLLNAGRRQLRGFDVRSDVTPTLWPREHEWDRSDDGAENVRLARRLLDEFLRGGVMPARAPHRASETASLTTSPACWRTWCAWRHTSVARRRPGIFHAGANPTVVTQGARIGVAAKHRLHATEDR